MSYFGQLPHNVSRSADLSASGWDTDPTDLDNAIDGDLDNPTGIGETTNSAPGYAGYIEIEMPAAAPYLITVKLDTAIALYGVSMHLHPKHNDYNTQANEIFNSPATALGSPGDSVMASFSSKIARLGIYVIDTSLVQVRLYDISIYRLC